MSDDVDTLDNNYEHTRNTTATVNGNGHTKPMSAGEDSLENILSGESKQRIMMNRSGSGSRSEAGSGSGSGFDRDNNEVMSDKLGHRLGNRLGHENEHGLDVREDVAQDEGALQIEDPRDEAIQDAISSGEYNVNVVSNEEETVYQYEEDDNGHDNDNDNNNYRVDNDESESYDQQSQYYDDHHDNDEEQYPDQYDEVYDEESASPDWRYLQEEYLRNRANHKAAKDAAMSPRRRANDVGQRTAERLYRQGVFKTRKKEAIDRKKKEMEEEEIRKRKAKVSKSLRSASAPRCLRLYDQGLVMNRRKKSREQQYEKHLKEKNKLELITRSSSRSRQTRESSNLPRHIQLYERAKMKQMKEKSKKQAEGKSRKTVRKNVSTPQRMNHLYELSRRSQQQGKERRHKIEKEKMQKKNARNRRSVSVNSNRSFTEPIEVGLYDRGMAKMRALEIKRSKAASERDDDTFKPSPLLYIR